MDKIDHNFERRRRHVLERTGNNPVCIACGCTDWYTLEGHHIAGRRFDPHVEYFCANCHRGFGQMQKSRPGLTSKSPGSVECAAHYCLGLSDIFWPAARMLEDFGHKLIQLADAGGDGGTKGDESLTRQVGHFLIVLAAILERICGRLKHHGEVLIGEATATKKPGQRAKRGPRRPAT